MKERVTHIFQVSGVVAQSSFLECVTKSELITGGETEDEKVRVDLLENQAMDFRNGFVMLCYTDFVSTTLKV